MASTFKKQCLTLRQQGLTLSEIVEKTRRPKTSVYFHIKDISLSARREAEITAKHIKRTINSNKSRRGKSLLGRHPILFISWTPELVSLVSHLLFDGEIKHYACVYHNRSGVLIKRVTQHMQKVYLYEPRTYKKDGVIRISYNNVELAAYFKIKAQELLKTVKKMNGECQRTFLQSFFDDEGCISFMGRKRQVRGYQHNYKVLKLVQTLLKNFDIESKIDKKYNEIIVSRKENLERFAKEINFSQGVRVNGNRSNSIWKESLEKREILRRALASYQS